MDGVTTSGIDLVDMLNYYFSSISADHSSLDLNALPAFLPAPDLPPTITHVEVCSKLLKVKSFKAHGPDSIPSWIIREYAIELAEPMAKIFNQSLSSSKVPTLWKDADLTPVPKIQAVTCENELQSIALTASLSKVLEDFVVTWLFQDIRHKIDINPHYLRVCFLDFSKAFDRINHNILITKLIALGARRCLIPWICDFLSNRRQAVKTNETRSDWAYVNAWWRSPRN